MSSYNYSKRMSFERQYGDTEVTKSLIDALYKELCAFEKRKRNRKKEDEKNIKSLLEAIILELYVSNKMDPLLFCAYSRGKNGYTQTHYTPDYLGYDGVIGITDFLLKSGYAEGAKGIRYKGYSKTSRIRAKNKLIKLVDKYTLLTPQMQKKRKETIQLKDLKDGKKVLVSYEDTEETKQMRDNLEVINQLLEETLINLELSNKEEKELADKIRKQHSGKEGDRLPVDFTQKQLYRVFNNGDFKQGGRFYGGWWQTIPSEYRRYITLEEKNPVEIDYAGMQVAQLYALAGKTVPKGDPYDLQGYDPKKHRKIIKKTFSAMLNAKDKKIRPVAASELPKGKTFAQLKKDIERKHSPISKYFYSGMGLKNQNIDAKIAERVLLHFAYDEVPVLPIHDSFIIRSPWALELKEKMIEFFEEEMGVSIKVTLDDYFPQTSPLEEIGAAETVGGISQIVNPSKLSEYLHKESKEYSNYYQREIDHYKVYERYPD